MKKGRYFCFMIVILSMFSASISFSQEGDLTREQRIQKAEDLYSSGRWFMHQGNYEAANEAFRKAQMLLEEVNPVAIPMAEPGPGISQVQPPEGLKEEDLLKLDLENNIDKKKKADMYYNKAVELITMNESQQAEWFLKETVRLNPKDAEAHYNLGALYETRLGEKKKALEHYRQYLRLSPKAKDAGQIKKWIEELASETEKR